MNTEPQVSIIVLSYFHEQYIEEAILSVLSQNMNFQYEIIVADDCSKDRTLEIVEDICRNNPNSIRIVRHETNVGTCKNLYDAMFMCRGKYIMLMAGDDVLIDENKVSKQYDFLEQKENSDYVAVCTAIKHVYTDGSDAHRVFPKKEYLDSEITINQFLGGVNYPDQGIMFRNIFSVSEAREQFSLLYKFSKYIEDLTINFFLYDYGKVYILPDITYALTVRRESDASQHNYNSIRTQKEKVLDHILLLNKINDYYHGKYNLQKRYSPHIILCLAISIKNDITFLSVLRKVPAKYILPSCLDYFKARRNSKK